MQPSVPFADQYGPGLKISPALIELGCKFSDISRSFWTVEEAKCPGIEVAQTVGLKPIGQNTK